MSTITQVAAAIQQEVFNTLGVAVDFSQITVADLKSMFQDLGTVQIAPSMCGPVGAMFKSITCSIKVGALPSSKLPLILVFMFSYDYEHSNGGHNGYVVKKEVTVEIV